MRKWMSLAVGCLLLMFAACGKNDGFSSVPNGYSGYGYSQPPTNLPLPPQNYPPPYSGMPQQFGPAYGYFAQQPQYLPYWNNLWQGWQNYANQVNVNVYDWNGFWNGYCAQTYPGFYDYLNINIYESGD